MGDEDGSRASEYWKKRAAESRVRADGMPAG
jgi:hypothetical protein